MLDRDRIVSAFQEALRAWGKNLGAHGVRPRTVAVRAHQIYCASLRPRERQPALMTFCMYVSGQSALPEIVELLETANIRPAARVRLDRKRLRDVFQEAVQRLEARILKGQARPLQIARRAYEIYTRDASKAASQPSHYTFERLIYGKTADPEILTLIESASLKRRKDGGEL